MSPSDPSNDALLELAEAALEEGNPHATLELCQRMLDRDPRHVSARYLEAEALRDLRALGAAEDAYRTTLRIAPEHPGAWSGLAAALFDGGRFDDATHAVQRAVRADPESPNPFYTRALLRERRGDEAGAKRDYLRAWRLGAPLGVPVTLSNAEIRALVEEAADQESEAVGAWVRALPLVIEELPGLAACEAAEPPSSPAELLGHLASRLEDEVRQELSGVATESTTLPPPIVVYRRNLGRYALDRQDLVVALGEQIMEQLQQWISTRSIEE